MDIAAYSVVFSQAKLAQNVGVSVLKMAMEQAEGQMNDMLKIMQVNTQLMERAVMPHLGANINVKV
ncbi:YjfB family protein [Thermosyntropha sp.]|uniref:YjfB family protein n=1 Tax=Thermosyntropha sp. TaxID=2740820 RepID=UPI0025CBF190|nr:YjfB family protein [Thermosyntropha sp.]MBO8159036.1 YjfB family protein [Thermosyntropha sp.]